MRIFRTEAGYAVDNAGVVRWLVGDLFGEWEPGDEIPDGLRGRCLLAPVRARGSVHCPGPGLVEPARAGCVNGALRQDSTTADLIFPVPELVATISSVMTLLPGDIISTGTPAGIGALRAGDTVRIGVDGVGELVNPVV